MEAHCTADGLIAVTGPWLGPHSTALVAVVAVLAAWFARSRLPPAVAAGVIAVALCAAVVLVVAGDGRAANPESLLVAFSLLAAGWLVAAALVRGAGADTAPSPQPTGELRAAVAGRGGAPPSDLVPVWLAAALVCGALAAGLAVATDRLGVAPRGGFALVTIVAALVVHRLVARDVGAIVVVVGLGAAAWPWIRRQQSLLAVDALRFWPLVAAALVLLLVVGLVLLEWRHRRAVWLDDPQRLAEPMRRPRLVGFLGGAVALAALAVAVELPASRWTPPTCFVACLAVFGLGHWLRRVWLGEAALALVAATLVSAGVAYVGGHGGAILGWAVASGLLLWLARFWDQQLLDGAAWTTAGRLIPAARRASLACAAVLGIVTVAALFRAPAVETGLILVIVNSLALLGLARIHSRDSDGRGGVHALMACCVVLVVLVEWIGAALPTPAGAAFAPLVRLGAVATLLLLLRIARPASAEALPLVNALVGGALPTAIVLSLLLRGLSTEATAAAILAAGAIATGTRQVASNGDSIAERESS